MKRSALTRRTPLAKRSATPATHRDCYTPSKYARFRARLVAAYEWRCAVCRRAAPLDLHHVVKRSRGGADHPDNCLPVCRITHDATDFPYDTEPDGRLVIQALGAGRFRWAWIRKASKWALDPPEVAWTEVGPT